MGAWVPLPEQGLPIRSTFKPCGSSRGGREGGREGIREQSAFSSAAFGKNSTDSLPSFVPPSLPPFLTSQWLRGRPPFLGRAVSKGSRRVAQHRALVHVTGRACSDLLERGGREGGREGRRGEHDRLTCLFLCVCPLHSSLPPSLPPYQAALGLTFHFGPILGSERDQTGGREEGCEGGREGGRGGRVGEKGRKKRGDGGGSSYEVG